MSRVFDDVHARITDISARMGDGDDGNLALFVPVLGDLKELLAVMTEHRDELRRVVSDETLEPVFPPDYEITVRSLIAELEAGRFCASCGCRNTALKRCAICRCTRYCSKECQTAHWKTHKRECRSQSTTQKPA